MVVIDVIAPPRILILGGRLSSGVSSRGASRSSSKYEGALIRIRLASEGAYWPSASPLAGWIIK